MDREVLVSFELPLYPKTFPVKGRGKRREKKRGWGPSKKAHQKRLDFSIFF